MLKSLVNVSSTINRQCPILLNLNQKRRFWEYVNMMFNKPDPQRINEVGPDRACAEWVLRNGGAVIWTGGQRLDDYNNLPATSIRPKLAVIDGSNSSISHYGFPHLSGCTMLHKIILHNDFYIDNRALKGLEHGKNSLTYVQISECPDVSDTGLKYLKELTKLETLALFRLTSVKDLEGCKDYLKTHLGTCKIVDESEHNS